eukprot:scaffold11212_cov121-Cylindrotheca_fusiformis.AAC.5
MAFYNRTTSNSSVTSSRPLPLKQRTSSKDTRRDYTHSTWISLLVLLKIREFMITVDNFSIWRRHLAWAMENGVDLKTYMTQRCASNMVFMSLLLSTELGVLYNSSPVTTIVREKLREGHHSTLSFWAGFLIIVSALLTILSLLSTFTAWAMVSSVDPNNAHCIFRSSIGQYAVELPGRLIVGSIYTFLISFVMYFFLLLPFGIWSIALLATTVFLFVHIVSVFSALGRIIMHTGAMGNERIFSPEYEELLLPHTLHANLLAKSKANLENSTSIIRQYRRKQKPIDRFLTEEELYDHLIGGNTTLLGQQLSKSNSNNSSNNQEIDDTPNRSRLDSTVRFSDEQQQLDPSDNTDLNAQNLSAISDVSIPKEVGSSAKTKKRPSSLQRPKYSSRSTTAATSTTTSERAPPIPSQDSFGVDSLIQNVSSSSLEQWLQASPKQTSSSSTGDISRGSQRSLSDGVVSCPPHPAMPSFARGTPPTNQQRRKRQQTPRHGKPTRPMTEVVSPEIQPIENSESELTEEERFNLDYGDIEDARTSSEDDDNLNGEMASLLRTKGDYSTFGEPRRTGQ